MQRSNGVLNEESLSNVFTIDRRSVIIVRENAMHASKGLQAVKPASVKHAQCLTEKWESSAPEQNDGVFNFSSSFFAVIHRQRWRSVLCVGYVEEPLMKLMMKKSSQVYKTTGSCNKSSDELQSVTKCCAGLRFYEKLTFEAFVITASPL